MIATDLTFLTFPSTWLLLATSYLALYFFHRIWSINIDQSQNSLMGFEMALNNVEKLLKAPWRFHFPDVSTFMMSEKQAPFHTGWCVTYLDLDCCSSWWNTCCGLKATLTWQKLSFYWAFCISLSSEKCYHYQESVQETEHYPHPTWCYDGILKHTLTQSAEQLRWWLIHKQHNCLQCATVLSIK